MHGSINQTESKPLTLGQTLLFTVASVQIVIILMMMDAGISAQNIGHAAPVAFYIKLESIVVVIGICCAVIFACSRHFKRGK